MKVRLYEILEVNSQASQEAINEAHTALARKYRSQGDAEEQLKLIDSAYVILSDPAIRAAYDAELAANAGHSSPQADNAPKDGWMEAPGQGAATAMATGIGTSDGVLPTGQWLRFAVFMTLGTLVVFALWHLADALRIGLATVVDAPPTVARGGSPGAAEEQVTALKKAAAEGSREAQAKLAAMYFHGQGVPQDHGQAVTLAKDAATQGDALGQTILALALEGGQGIAQDDRQAAYWFGMAAEQGASMAQWHLGKMYLQGAGIPRDLDQAVYWHHRAAEQGLADAQYGLCIIYSGGVAIPREYGKAMPWCRKAAEQGVRDAQMVLAILHAKGEGTPRDYAAAYFWFSVATANETDAQRVAANNRALNELAQQMSAEQLAAAQERASQWRRESDRRESRRQ